MGVFSLANLSLFACVYWGTCVSVSACVHNAEQTSKCHVYFVFRSPLQNLLWRKYFWKKKLIMLALTQTRLHKDAWTNTHAEYVAKHTDCGQDVCLQMTTITCMQAQTICTPTNACSHAHTQVCLRHSHKCSTHAKTYFLHIQGTLYPCERQCR